MTNAVTVGISPTLPNQEWDEVLLSLPSGSLSQSAGWAEFHRLRGHEVVHVAARRGPAMVGGATLVVRRLPLGRTMGHVARGPVGTRQAVVSSIVEKLIDLADSERLDPMIVDPADAAAAAALADAGFVEAKMGVTLPATVVVDVNNDDETLLGSMKAKTRYNIRKGLRSGITVRTGNAADAQIFEHLMNQTGSRKGFVADGASYVRCAFEALPYGSVALLIAENDGKDLAAVLLTAFGDRVTYKRGGWSGQQGNLHPNEVLHWAAIRWTRDTGRREYDFDGIDLQEFDDPGSTRSVSHFKMGFGGRIVDLPRTLVRFRNPVLRLAHDRIGPTAMRRVKRAARRLQVAV